MAARQRGAEEGRLGIGQRFLGGACGHEQRGAVVVAAGLAAGLRKHEVRDGVVVVVAAQGRIATRRDHFEHALREPQDRDVEGAAAQVIDRIDAFARVVQAVGDGCGGRLADETQHVQARELRRVLGRLALAFVEVGRHGDDGAVELVVEGVFGAVAQRGQDLGADLDGRLLAGRGLHLDHAAVVTADAVRHGVAVRDVGQAAAHEPLDRGDGVGGVLCACSHGLEADLAAIAVEVAHGRGQQHAALVVGQAFGHAVAHRGHQRMRGAQVDAHGDAALVRVGRLAGFGNLKKSHKGLLSQLIEFFLDVLAEALNEHEGSHLLNGTGVVALLVDQPVE
ncbi:NAD-specific glutamate dehydrogenase [compost metagenome]